MLFFFGDHDITVPINWRQFKLQETFLHFLFFFMNKIKNSVDYYEGNYLMNS